MSWLYFATAGYFLNAFSALGDKIILGKILPKPLSYAFWQGVLSLAVLFLIPFGFSILGPQNLILSLSAGILWIFGLYFFFEALFLSDASRTLPIILSLSPLFLFLFESFGLNRHFSSDEILGALFLIAGSVFLSLNLEGNEHYSIKRFGIFAILAAFFFSLSLFLMKGLFLKETFLNVFIWSRFGMFLGALSLLILPSGRFEIFQSADNVIKPRNSSSIILVKIIGSAGALCIFFAIARGSVTLVNALQGLQYAFIFMLAFIASVFWPKLLHESFSFKSILQKLSGIILVSIGLFLLLFHIT